MNINKYLGNKPTLEEIAKLVNESYSKGRKAFNIAIFALCVAVVALFCAII